MDTKFENKLFQGEIDSLATGDLILPIDKGIYRDPDHFSGKLNEYRQKIVAMQMDLMEKANLLEREIIEWNTKYPRLLSSVEEVESNVNDRLFLRSDTEGFYKTIFENFTTTDAVDLVNSTNVETDITNNIVTLAHASNIDRKINQSSYRISVSKAPNSGPERVIPIPGSSLNNLFQNGLSGWTGSVTTANKIPVSIVFDIVLNEETEIGEITLCMADSGSSTKISAIAIDKNNNANVVLDAVDISNTNIISINGKVKKVQVVLTKNSYDERLTSGEYRFIFHLTKLEIFKSLPGFKTEGEFLSSKYLVNGNSKIALEVCDFTSPDTNIEYYLQIQDFTNSTNSTESIINPINKAPSSAPYAIKIDSQKMISNITNPLPIDSTKASDQAIAIMPEMNLYKFTEEHKVLNQNISISPDNIGSINVFANYINETLLPMDLIEQVGNEYHTWIYVDGSNQRVLDVGPSGIVVEGLPVINQKITLDKSGWYKVKIPIAAYNDVGNNFDNVETLKNFDRLYPYNGKYLIEGTNLSIAPYLGFKKRAKKKLAPTLNLENLNGSNYYLLRNFNLSFAGVNQFVALLSKEVNSKNVYIEYQQKGDFIYYLNVKAKLKTADQTRTPVLSSYKIKLGD